MFNTDDKTGRKTASPFDLTGHVAWITGSGSGIGTAIARLFAAANATVVLHGLNQRETTMALQAEITEQGGRAHVLDGDLTCADTVAEMCNEIQRELGSLSILVNCAGGSPHKSTIADMAEDVWDSIIKKNLKSAFLACRTAIPLLKQARNPAIVNVSSCVTRSGGVPGGAAYATAKGGIDVLTRALAKELAADGIRVNAVAPGLVDSPFHGVDVDAKEKYAHLIGHIPLARIGEPEDLAGPALFLASSAAAYVTGEIIEVSGGTRLVS